MLFPAAVCQHPLPFAYGTSSSKVAQRTKRVLTEKLYENAGSIQFTLCLMGTSSFGSSQLWFCLQSQRVAVEAASLPYAVRASSCVDYENTRFAHDVLCCVSEGSGRSHWGFSRR